MSENQTRKPNTLADYAEEFKKLTNQDMTFLDAIKDNAMKKAQLFMDIANQLGSKPPVENRAQRRAREKLEKKTKQ